MRFTIVTVCFNSAATIGQTLASVAAQDFDDYEHLVVDGLSTDGTKAIVTAQANPRLRWVSEADAGMYDAMNKGLRMAKGDYVLFLNSDDYLVRDDALSLVSAKIDETEADCILADTMFVKADGSPAARRYSARNFGRWWMRVGVMPPHPSTFARRTLLQSAGGFDTRYRIAADFDLMARVFLKQRASWASLAAVTTAFRLGGVSTGQLRANARIGREAAHSLKALGQRSAGLAVQLRFLLKARQYFRFGRDRQGL